VKQWITKEAEAIPMMRSVSSLRRTAMFVFYNIAAALILLLVLEGIASVFSAFRETAESRPLAERLHTKYDRELGWVNLPNVYRPNMYGPGKYLRTNSQGFRNNVDFPTQIPPGKTRIICSGDSHTLGYGVDNDHTWPQLFAARASNIETVNMGQGGYGADQVYLWYKRDGAVLDHDIQILAVTPPDFHRMQVASFRGYGKPVVSLENGRLVTKNVPVPMYLKMWSPRLARAGDTLSNLQTTHLLRKILKLDANAPVAEKQKARDQETTQVLALMLDDLAATNRAKQSTLVLVYLPTRPEYADPMEAYWRKFMSDYAQQRGVLFLDLADDFKGLPAQELDKLFIAKGAVDFPGATGHYTEAGNALVADLIYRGLLSNPETAAKLQPAGHRH